MLKRCLEFKMAIVGAGKFCKKFIEYFYYNGNTDIRPKILGVADKCRNAPGRKLAEKMGLFTTNDYTKLYDLKGLQLILELTNDPTLADVIAKTKPDHIEIIDHFDARTLWDTLLVESIKDKGLKELEGKKNDPAAIVSIFEKMTDQFSSIIQERNNRSREIEKELFQQERSVSQIIQGSTIPTFVINKDHVVTHWNKAMEKLVGYKAEEIVGTKNQWLPFYNRKRHTMADVILDHIEEREIKKLYGDKWQKSPLIAGAYQAEDFFPKLGENGKWCFFTAAPIKAPDGCIIGAIETLWDKTEDKRAEEEKERYTRELSTLLAIYTALSSPMDFKGRIDNAMQELMDFLNADGVCIFLVDHNGDFHLKYSKGLCEDSCKDCYKANPDCIINWVAQTGNFTILEDPPQNCSKKVRFLVRENFKSLVYIPISNKEREAFGVIRIGSKKTGHFSYQKQDILELIANRIGVAIENAMLQEQYIRSEEKYRTLFNNDPNPIFIIDSSTFKIQDINQRAQDKYGFAREELSGVSFLKLGDPDDNEVSRGLKKLSREHSLLFSKKRHYRKDGKAFFVNISVSYAQYCESNVMIATTSDISESVEKETQLIQASKMTTLGVMAAGMAHEINQPLNVIQICADFFLKMLKRKKPIKDEDLRSMANDIIENVDRATKVIKHVRDFARQSEVKRSKININEPLEDVFKVLGHQLKVHQIELILNLEPDIPPIMADHNRMEQVFINLVTNAIDALDEKAEKKEYKDSDKKLCIKSFTENNNVIVTVRDTGIGMTDEVKEKLFEPFFTTKKTGRGTGLGVSISYGIVKDYDGDIEIESKLGVGTTFKLKFPAMQQNA